MTTAEKAKAALTKTNNSNGNGSAKEVLLKAKRPGTMLGLKAGDVKSVIEAYKPLISQALPKHLTAERIVQVATTLISRTPELAECSVESLIGSVMQCSILGFEPIPSLGQAYLIPFNNKKTGKREIQFIIGYKGLIDLARRSNQIKTIYAQAVYSNDEFNYEYGLEPNLHHKPALGERGDFIYAYAVAKFTNDGYAFEVMSKADIEKIRKTSQAGDSKYSPWNSGFYEEMAKKTVLRRLSKMLPVSIEHQKPIASDESVLRVDNFNKDGEVDLNSIDNASFEVEDEQTDNNSDETSSDESIFPKEKDAQ
jgi:recombination protein RecT